MKAADGMHPQLHLDQVPTPENVEAIHALKAYLMLILLVSAMNSQ